MGPKSVSLFFLLRDAPEGPNLVQGQAGKVGDLLKRNPAHKHPPRRLAPAQLNALAPTQLDALAPTQLNAPRLNLSLDRKSVV